MDNDTRWLITQEVPHLRRFARTLAYTPEKADDLVQDTLERALKKSRLWRRSKGTMRSWLFKMLYNIHLNKLKKETRKGVHVGFEDVAHLLMSKEAGQEGRVALNQTVLGFLGLPKDQKDALALVAIEEMPYEEAANVLDVPVGTLRSRVSRAREAMRDNFSTDAFDDDNVTPLYPHEGKTSQVAEE